jgi:protein-tyrosine-phosphatase
MEGGIAGTWAIDGHSVRMLRLCSNRWFDHEEHISQNVSNVDLNDFDLILTMERGHKEALLAEFPEFSDRIFMLSEMINSTFDVADPIGGGVSDYNKTARFLDDLMRRGYPKIKALSSKPG